MIKRKAFPVLFSVLLFAGCAPAKKPDQPVQISGIFPHLANYNNEGECGTGAVVPWAGKLRVITYGPHLPHGSSDKLYSISADMERTIHPESIGGTPANRMIHRESNQLFIGPYAIDGSGIVRTIPYTVMPGRHTGNARHLTDPAGKIYYGTMEEGFYEVDVKTLQTVQLYKDGNSAQGSRVVHNDTDVNPENAMLPGAHGKGLYSGQGVLVYSNNEVATERDLFNCSGTFYELPAENADGFAKIRPIASHNFRIYDYASYRGMLIMTGIDPEMDKGNSHVIISEDGNAAVWAGVIDDLWQMGKPVGEGGPWKDSEVRSGVASDPYLIGFYDKRSLKLSHNSKETVAFTIETEPIGHGPWMTYQTVSVKSGVTYEFSFPETFQSRWIRFVSNQDCQATAWLKFE